MRPVPATICAGAMALVLASCMTQESAEKAVASLGGSMPDSMPTMLNETPPFLYPTDLYAQQVQGNVTLRVFIDSTGALVPESTSVAESSGYPAFDSAAVKGTEKLQFLPGKKGNRPISLAVLLPVYFRHPQAAPLPGDTILRRYP